MASARASRRPPPSGLAARPATSSPTASARVMRLRRSPARKANGIAAKGTRAAKKMPWRTESGTPATSTASITQSSERLIPPAQSTGANCFLRACGQARQRRTSATTNPTSTAIPTSDWTALKIS